MNDRAQDVIQRLVAETDVAKLLAFVFETAASSEVVRSFATVSRQAVPAAFQQFVKRVLGEGYVLVNALNVRENAHAELVAVPHANQVALKLWHDETLDRLRELTERREAGERLLLRCACLAYEIAIQLLEGMSAETFLCALPRNEDEEFVVRCMLDVFTVRKAFSAGVTQLVPFALLAQPPASVQSSKEETATGWIVRRVCSDGAVTLAAGSKGRKYGFECPDFELQRQLFVAFYSGCSVNVRFVRVYSVGMKQPTRWGVLQHVEVVGPTLIHDQ